MKSPPMGEPITKEKILLPSRIKGRRLHVGQIHIALFSVLIPSEPVGRSALYMSRLVRQ